MDVLTDALAAMRVGQTRSARTEVRAPWGLRFPAVGGTTFHVLLRGRCWLLPPDGEPVAMAAGDVTLLRHGSTVSLADDPATPLQDFRPGTWRPGQTIGRVDVEGPGERSLLVCGAYQLRRTRPHPLLAELPDLLLLRADETPGLAAAVALLGAELEEARAGQDGVVPALVDAMLLLILRAWIERCARGAADIGWPGALTDAAISVALAALHDEPGRAWTVAGLGDRAGLSRSAFAQRFTALVGEPPLTYLTWWRMTVAGRLLRESDAPLSAVAERVGYASEFAFAKAFKREFGIAPGRYRREAAVAA
ncbi:AraC family transcriptional regulator [Catenulispora sp. NF23]|uniref:AraC family transcriptional regulator n=1 Tax=Catenulispora pinistramenti TaxID=2705254 RepID=UPI001BAB7ECB|nr:AraC family transcriptional regulator [Catenulispora pinistramenti]MBS2536917.1 AraC family transcriptional regulator [Catenulispora pinistramenti]